MLQKIQKYMEELNMVSSGEKIFVGVSGGADSVCLLQIMFLLSREKDISLEVIHVEHGIRGEESRQDAVFVEELCRRMNLVCHKVSVNVPDYSKEKGLGLEEAARILRYEVFSKFAKEKNAKVALAHHMEDNAETILFQMLRGSSLAGLCGMQPIRWDENGICYIRPLLLVHRNEIEVFLESYGLNYRVDSTNHELDYSRNYLRNVVIPSLTKVNAQAINHINDMAFRLSEIKDFLNQEVERYSRECIEKSEKGVCLDTEKLSGLHLAVQKELIYKAISIAAGTKKDISAVHVDEVRNLCEKQSGKEICLPYQIRARKEYSKLWLVQEQKEEILSENMQYDWIDEKELQRCLEQGKEYHISIGQAGEKILIRVFSKDEKSMEFPKNPYTKWMDYDKIKQGFCIRTRKSGDYFICDDYGHHKKIKQYFVDEKIPAGRREKIWLLTQDHLVLWVVGGRMSEHTKITEDTKRIIQITYQGGE